MNMDMMTIITVVPSMNIAVMCITFIFSVGSCEMQHMPKELLYKAQA